MRTGRRTRRGTRGAAAGRTGGAARGGRPVRSGILLAAGFALGLAGPARAQEPGDLITDRPDQTESAATVAPGFVQFEGGWSFAFEEEGTVEVREHSFGEALLRVGVAPDLEARFGFSGIIDREVEVETDGGTTEFGSSGAGDLEIGAKYRIFGEEGARPELALLGSATLPTGEAGFTSDRVDPRVRASLAHTLSENVSLGYNVGLEWNTADLASGERVRLVDGLYTLAAGFGLGDRLGTFVELFGFAPISDESVDRHSLNGGFTYLLRPNLQLDAFGGFGLVDDADDWFLGAGVSARLPR